MRTSSLASAVAVVALLASSGCSFQGSVSDDVATRVSHTSVSSTTPPASSSAATSTTPQETSSAATTTLRATTSTTRTSDRPTPSESGLLEIRFAPGGTSTSVQGIADTGMQDRYFFDATAGQTATVSIASDGDVAGFTLVSPDGMPLKTLASEATTGSFALPASGSYVVQALPSVPEGELSRYSYPIG